MTWRFRLLPAIIFCAAFTLSLKLGGLWQGVDALVSPTSAIAQEQGGQKSAKKQSPTAPSDGAKPAGEPDEAGKTAGGSKAENTRRTRFDPRLVTDSELDILEKLSKRRAELDQRSHELDTREKVLRATEARIEAKIADLKQIQDTISKLLVKHDKQKEAQMRSVVKIYERMKPKDAARVFQKLDMPILLDIVERMREAKAAPIMANMSPDKAKAVTAALAQRRALPKLDRKQVN